MLRSELIAHLAQDTDGLSATEVQSIVDVVLDSIAAQLADGGRVELRGFGTFTTRGRPARQGRNPRTGEQVDVDAKRLPHFKPGKELRQALSR